RSVRTAAGDRVLREMGEIRQRCRAVHFRAEQVRVERTAAALSGANVQARAVAAESARVAARTIARVTLVAVGADAAKESTNRAALERRQFAARCRAEADAACANAGAGDAGGA